MKLFGAFGYSNEYPCGRFLRDGKQFETLERVAWKLYNNEQTPRIVNPSGRKTNLR